MEKGYRKQIKKKARGVVRRHYALLLFVCLIAAVLGTEFTDSLEILKIGSSQSTESSESTDTDSSDDSVITSFGLDEAYTAIVEDQIQQYEEKMQTDNEAKSTQIGMISVGRTRGILATLVNQLNSGTLLIVFYNAVHGMFESKDAVVFLFILLAVLVYLAFYVFISNLYEVIMGRIFLEARTYEKVPIARFLYLFRIRRWVPVALALLRKNIYEMLWSLTVVGGAIKHYSYFCVPYILAENPKISGKDAILLSRRMMDGHKWEAFVLELSFIVWNLLDLATYHLVGLFFLNSYQTCTYAEYYAKLRENWIRDQGEGYELLCDRYLFEKPDHELLVSTYSDIESLKDIPDDSFGKGHGFARFMAKNFSIILKHDENEMNFLRGESRRQRVEAFSQMIDGATYPTRLSVIPEKEKDPELEGTGYLRCYTVTSLILIFFTICILGWVWEVSLHMITDHELVNRGVLHGPWLPIYGSGSILILLLLNRFRKNMSLEFGLSMLLAGVVEYMTAWQLEIANNGQKWWDYSGYFLNLHGRICAEGLLVFGIGGVAVVYVLAPMLDNLFRKIPKKVMVTLCTVLLAVYLCDTIYSSGNPNTGKGITDYTVSAQPEADPFSEELLL